MKKKRHEHHEEHMDESWLIPYADLLTLLLALFIILFAMSKMDTKKYDTVMHSLNSAFTGGVGMMEKTNVVPILDAPNVDEKKEENPNSSKVQANNQLQNQSPQQTAEVETQNLAELQKALEAYIQGNGLSTQLETKFNEGRLKIIIRDFALFESGSASIKPEAQKLASTISHMLEDYSHYNVEVAGYTDNRPIHTKEFETNWDLSAKRSLNFMKILIQNDKIDPSKYRAIGYGQYQPIDTNDTEEGRSKNRRVEVNITKELKSSDDQVITP